MSCVVASQTWAARFIDVEAKHSKIALSNYMRQRQSRRKHLPPKSHKNLSPHLFLRPPNSQSIIQPLRLRPPRRIPSRSIDIAFAVSCYFGDQRPDQHAGNLLMYCKGWCVTHCKLERLLFNLAFPIYVERQRGEQRNVGMYEEAKIGSLR